MSREADGRSDIFAFGLTFYEMLTGRRAFDGDNAASVISAIMTAEPPALPQQPLAAPPALDRVLRMCIAKDPDDRWQSASDVRRALQLVAATSESAEAEPLPKRFRWGCMAVAVLVRPCCGNPRRRRWSHGRFGPSPIPARRSFLPSLPMENRWPSSGLARRVRARISIWGMDRIRPKLGHCEIKLGTSVFCEPTEPASREQHIRDPARALC